MFFQARVSTDWRTCRAPLALALLLIAAGTPLSAQRSEQVKAPAPVLLRYAVADGDTIWLGRPIGKYARYAMVAGDSLIRIPTPLFDGADGLLIMRDSTERVHRIVFLYDEKRNIDNLMKEQYSNFGREASYSSAPVPEGFRESWTWLDKRTEFTITRFTPAQHNIAALVVIATFRNDPP